MVTKIKPRRIKSDNPGSLGDFLGYQDEATFKRGEGGGLYTAGRGIEIKNGDDYSAMRGPCPEGFHIPLASEWGAIVDILDTNFSISTGTDAAQYLKIPLCGYYNGGISNVNYIVGLWTSTSAEDSWPITNSMFWIRTNGGYNIFAVTSTNQLIANNLRPFKDTPVIPDSGWTTLYAGIGNAGIFHNSGLGLISISGDGTSWYTMSDKNLGATIVYNNGDTFGFNNCGYFYQFGNNWGFEYGTTPEIGSSSEISDITQYGPNNYLYYNKFINETYWNSSNRNLRGGITGVQEYHNAITNTGVLSVNGQTGDVTIPTTGESNTKTFYITNVGDSQAAIDEAQPILDWYLDGKNPVINWNDCIWIMTESRLTGTPKQLYFKRNKPEFSNNSLGYGTSLLTDELCINFVNDTVQETIHFNGNRYVDFLETHTDYLVPYEPLYQGSPATKKYVDDNTNTKTFYLSNTSDLTTAQAVVDWIITGKTAFILFNGAVYKQRDRNTSGGNERFFFSTDDNSTVQNTNLGNTVIKHLELQINSDETTHIVSTVSTSEKYLGKYINIDGSYSKAFIPTQDYHPATKKYVDDKTPIVSSTTPSNPTEGMLWYDTTNNILKSYDGANWNDIGITYSAGTGINIDANNEITNTGVLSVNSNIGAINLKTINNTSIIGIGDIATPITTVEDNLTSTSATNALSANQGRILDGKIADLMALGKFLSLWNAATGQPISFPYTTPYAYSTGDYFLVEVVDITTSYRPDGSSYTGIASSIVETDELEQGDVYIYDGSVWLLQSNHGKTVSFANITGQPTDNTNLATALAAKQDNLTAGTGISISSNTVTNTGVTSFNGNTGAITYTAPVTSVNGQAGDVTVQGALNYYSEGSNTANVTVGSGNDVSSINAATTNDGVQISATKHGYATSGVKVAGPNVVVTSSDSINTTTMTLVDDNVTIATPAKTYTFDSNSTTGVARLSEIIQNDTTGTTTTVTKIWAGTEAEYNALSTHDASTIYHIY